MSNESEDEATQVQGNIITNIDEEVNEEVNDVVTHWNIVMKKVEKGQLKGQEIKHFYCKYCSKSFQGPSSGTILKHLRKIHATKCPELLPKATNKNKSSHGFFDKVKMKEPFNEDVFMGKLLKWILKTDQAFSVVDNIHFEELLEYLKKDITIKSRTTIMNRLEELYEQKKCELKEKLNGIQSKYSITCDIWTAKNQISFFGFTIHYIDDDWQMKVNLLAFKCLKVEHDGQSLSKTFIGVLEEYGIADRLLGVTADNASNNSRMLAFMEIS